MLPVTVTLEGATVQFGDRTALDGFSGSFRPGTVTALIGGDGAGKSTLLKVLAGRLTTNNTQGSGLPVEAKNIGYQPAGSGVWRNLSVLENIEFVTRVYGLDPAKAQARVSQLLAQAGLDQVGHRPASQLSGGMRQKLGVILATFHQPGLVLLDEPTTGVDPISRAELWTMMAAAAAEGATVVFATTYLDEAERATRLFLLGAGKLLASGTPDQVIALTPGAIWQAPATHGAAQRALESPTAWRRGGSVYLWTPQRGDAAPVGFQAAPGDMENTSIALLLAAQGGADVWPDGLGAPKAGGEHVEHGEQSERQGRDQQNEQNRRGKQNQHRGHSERHEQLEQNEQQEHGEHGEGGHQAPLVQASGVARTYGTFLALDGVSLEVGPGEVVGLLGGNGAGKTTLMRILLGLETPTAGTSTLFGRKPSLDTRRHIGYVAQGLGLYPSLSAMENLQFAASVHGIKVNEAARRFATAFGRSPIGSLPLGTKRILAYLAAGQHKPELMILDEPTSGMDALTRARLWRDLQALADQGTGILVTTHYMQEAAQCDRLYILTVGKVTATGTVTDITAAHTSLTVEGSRWDQAFTHLRQAGLPVLLDGRTLRLPGASRDAVEATLAPLGGDYVISTAQATLAETMMLAQRDGNSR